MRKNMLRKFAPLTTKLFALTACSVLMAASLFAQSQATTGDIEGRVLDPNGAAVPNATVTGVNQATGFERTVTADGEGNYRLILLPPGSYTVRANAQGFAQTELRDVQVTVGGKTPLEVKLTVSGTSESVTVTGE